MTIEEKRWMNNAVEVVGVRCVERLADGEKQLVAAIRDIVREQHGDHVTNAVSVHHVRLEHINIFRWDASGGQRCRQPRAASKPQCWALLCHTPQCRWPEVVTMYVGQEHKLQVW